MACVGLLTNVYTRKVLGLKADLTSQSAPTRSCRPSSPRSCCSRWCTAHTLPSVTCSTRKGFRTLNPNALNPMLPSVTCSMRMEDCGLCSPATGLRPGCRTRSSHMQGGQETLRMQHGGPNGCVTCPFRSGAWLQSGDSSSRQECGRPRHRCASGAGPCELAAGAAFVVQRSPDP